jgi:hypothetical protein
MQISSNILLHESGQMAIMFEDVNFVRSEAIYFDSSTGYLHTVLDGRVLSIGHVSGQLAREFSKQSSVQLSGLRPDGTMLDLNAKLVILH